MGKLHEFDITFTNNKVVYSPGESISGCVKITCSGSLKYIEAQRHSKAQQSLRHIIRSIIINHS